MRVLADNSLLHYYFSYLFYFIDVYTFGSTIFHGEEGLHCSCIHILTNIMPNIQCPVQECDWTSGELETALVIQMLDLHTRSSHANLAVQQQQQPTALPNKQRAPKINPPKISEGSTEETWNSFKTRWDMFTRSTVLTAAEKVQQLFHCCEDSLGDSILKGHNTAVTGSEEDLLKIIKQLAVVPVPRVARRNEVLNLTQDQGETTRAFSSRIKGKASTCAYTKDCTGCNTAVDYSDDIVKDVLIEGLYDMDIKREVIGWTDVDAKTVEETVSFVEKKEMARNAMNDHSNVTAVSTYKKQGKPEKNVVKEKPKSAKGHCPDCNVEIETVV